MSTRETSRLVKRRLEANGRKTVKVTDKQGSGIPSFPVSDLSLGRWT